MWSMSTDSRATPGLWTLADRLARGAALALLVACNYSLRGGGGLPDHIETIYIDEFDNQTTQFDLAPALFTELTREIPSTLGLQVAGQERADAVLRGVITGYGDEAQNIRPDERSAASVAVLQRQVTITLRVEMLDVERNVILWDGSLTGRGEYQPDAGQTLEAGRLRAIEDLLQQIRDRAQSQW